MLSLQYIYTRSVATDDEETFYMCMESLDHGGVSRILYTRERQRDGRRQYHHGQQSHVFPSWTHDRQDMDGSRVITRAVNVRTNFEIGHKC